MYFIIIQNNEVKRTLYNPKNPKRKKSVSLRCLMRVRTRVLPLAKRRPNQLSYPRLRTYRNYITPDVCNWDRFGLKFEHVYSNKFEKMSYRTYLRYKATLNIRKEVHFCHWWWWLGNKMQRTCRKSYRSASRFTRFIRYTLHFNNRSLSWDMGRIR